MKQCKKCGTELLDEAAFCSQCGCLCEYTTVEEESETTLLDSADINYIEKNEGTALLEETETALLDNPEEKMMSGELEETTLLTDATDDSIEEEEGTTVLDDLEVTQKTYDNKRVNSSESNSEESKTQNSIQVSNQTEGKNSEKKIIIAILVSCVLLVIIGCIIYALITADEEYSVNEEETTIAATSVSTTKTTTTTEYSEPDYWEGECGDNASFIIQYETDDNGKKYLTLNIEGTGAMWSWENIDWKIEDTSRVERIFVLNDISTIPENEFGEFTGVKYVYIMNSVKSIGKWAFDGLDSLKEVWIYNRDCKINYIYADDDGSTRYAWTLGSPKNKVEIICVENSTAEDYVNTFNNGTDTPGYKLSHIVKE